MVAGSSLWQTIFVSFALILIAFEIVRGWRLGLVRQLIRLLALAAAYATAIFAGRLLLPVLRPLIQAPDFLHLDRLRRDFGFHCLCRDYRCRRDPFQTHWPPASRPGPAALRSEWRHPRNFFRTFQCLVDRGRGAFDRLRRKRRNPSRYSSAGRAIRALRPVGWKNRRSRRRSWRRSQSSKTRSS